MANRDGLRSTPFRGFVGAVYTPRGKRRRRLWVSLVPPNDHSHGPSLSARGLALHASIHGLLLRFSNLLRCSRAVQPPEGTGARLNCRDFASFPSCLCCHPMDGTRIRWTMASRPSPAPS